MNEKLVTVETKYTLEGCILTKKETQTVSQVQWYLYITEYNLTGENLIGMMDRVRSVVEREDANNEP